MRSFFTATWLFAAACGSGGEQQGRITEELGNACLAGGADSRACDPADTKKTTICHIPPGNPANQHTLCVGNPSVPAHLDHGDHLDACDVDCQPDGGTPPPTGGTTGGGGTDADAGVEEPIPVR